MPTSHPELGLLAPSAAAEEGAAIVAALERFRRETTPSAAAAAEPQDLWTRAGLLEDVAREPDGRSAWGDAHPWR